MSISVFSALTLMCLDGAMAARPIEPVDQPVEPQVVAVAAMDDEKNEPVPAADTEQVLGAEVDPEVGADEVISVGEEPLPGLVFDEETDAQVVARLVDYIEGIKTLSGDFTQFAPSGAISTGRFYLRRPGLLRFEYDPPSSILIVANSGLVYVHDEALETTDSYPVGKTPLKFFLRKKVDLDDTDIIRVDRGVDSVAVTFGSLEDEAEGELTVIVSAPEMSLTRWIIRDAQNGSTVVALENVKAGEKIPNRLFEAPDAGGRFLKN